MTSHYNIIIYNRYGQKCKLVRTYVDLRDRVTE